ncbi:MAG TPA: hypothetical protein PKM99_10860 [Thermotogota bacterium]|nr:hypothetical protein [Thermotogota bacterium]NLZ15048.1 hypothetical protein [Thermotogaceae bacterium]HNR64539.1 hypothetical protein [Thermotogota bacterium]HNT96597.1 hypothetical protein [Thermotogota bacterium]HPB88292.1 hypothetical protein [Thermotogota bacterium]
MRIVIFSLAFMMILTSGFGGWLLPAGVKPPSSYQGIDRAFIVDCESNLSNGPITYRSGHYTSLMEYSGEFTDILKPGSIIVYKTNAGNYGKMKITGYALYHAWSKVSGYKYCDVPFFEFTTYLGDGSILMSDGLPTILDGVIRVAGKTFLYGTGPIRSPYFFLNLQYANYPERPQGSCFMWFNFDFDTKQTGFFKNYNGIEFSGADLYNEKNETRSRFFPSNGAIFAVVYKP